MRVLILTLVLIVPLVFGDEGWQCESSWDTAKQIEWITYMGRASACELSILDEVKKALTDGDMGATEDVSAKVQRAVEALEKILLMKTETGGCKQDCHEHATCTTSDDSNTYSCTCNPGFTGDGVTCEDVNECGFLDISCGAHATCNNTMGSYECNCDPGYERTGKECTQKCSGLDDNVVYRKKCFWMIVPDFTTNTVDYQTAVDLCKAEGATPANILSERQYKKIIKYIIRNAKQHIYVYTGMQFDTSNGDLTNFDGTKAKHVHWRSGDPVYVVADPVDMSKVAIDVLNEDSSGTGMLTTAPQWKKHGVICQISE